MTAKEKLRKAVEEPSEGGEEGERTAATLDEFLDSAPLDDEPETPEEREAVAEAREELRRGEVISAEEIKREIA